MTTIASDSLAIPDSEGREQDDDKK